MALTKKDFAAYIKQFKFRELFNDMGWNNDKTSQPVTIDNITYSLHAVAEKSGFKILVCNPTEAGTIPDYSTRKKIETKLTKLFQEHLIIFIDAKKQEQIWQLVVRQSGKPAKVTETRYHVSQDPELLFQRASGIFFEMDEEENITIVDVTKRVADNFHQNNEKVTKQFYESFKKQHTSFLSFIKGIDGKADKDWYASLMLNRLMFCYFIQKKGFLDNNKNYLRDKLNLCKEKKGKDKFYSFYRSFLLVLFHEGLNEPAQKEKIKIEIGKIPYLNGGLFDEHELEKSYDIDIDDKAFERIFDFFDQYEWHLDTRIEATGKDINPDVIGYIFEKYINDRAQMGAYYTKEDITDYISKNCIIPWLFDETARNYPKAFTAKGEIWKALQESGDAYIYDAVKYGTDIALPKNIQAGIKDVAKRTDWNKQATTDLGLPTEIWREVVERRNRYEEVKSKIESGEITAINDFITYNLNIRQFTQDIVENSDDSDFIRAFYKAIISVTIIDPTCGSGAFLFAAMNILEPLYHACIMRMRAFTEDEDRQNEREKKTFKNKYKYFREVLENIQSDQHPNLQYFIYKSIILNNLYGVDIMREAVEIAKLRLFLKLVATVEANYKKKNLGLEPLPDIDFNIRAGNTLIGFATKNELEKGGNYTFDFDKSMPKIEEKCDVVSKAFNRYKSIQLDFGDDISGFKKAKDELNKRLKELNNDLNKLLHKQVEGIKFDQWITNYQPFHWFAEFYEIVHEKKGFDIVIGNPPYVEHTALKLYKIKGYQTDSCGNLYANVSERALLLMNETSRFGFIVPISLTCSKRMLPIQKLLLKKGTYFSNWSWRPSKLFEGADKANLSLTIFLTTNQKQNFSSTYNRWNAEARDYIFDKLSYTDLNDIKVGSIIPKIGSELEKELLAKVQKLKTIGQYVSNSPTPHKLFYRRTGGLYWKIFTDFRPELYLNGKKTFSSKEENFDFVTNEYLYSALALLWSDLYWWWYQINSDVRNNNPSDLKSLPVIDSLFNDVLIVKLAKELMLDLKKNSIWDERKYKGNVSKFQKFFPKHSKHIIDKIDGRISDILKLTTEEKEFIINYDLKYRMGKETEDDE